MFKFQSIFINASSLWCMRTDYTYIYSNDHGLGWQTTILMNQWQNVFIKCLTWMQSSLFARIIWKKKGKILSARQSNLIRCYTMWIALCSDDWIVKAVSCRCLKTFVLCMTIIIIIIVIINMLILICEMSNQLYI